MQTGRGATSTPALASLGFIPSTRRSCLGLHSARGLGFDTRISGGRTQISGAYVGLSRLRSGTGRWQKSAIDSALVPTPRPPRTLPALPVLPSVGCTPCSPCSPARPPHGHHAALLHLCCPCVNLPLCTIVSSAAHGCIPAFASHHVGGSPMCASSQLHWFSLGLKS